MCSIFGMLFFNGVVPTTEHRGILTRLMLAGQTRGTDATGLSFAKKDEVIKIGTKEDGSPIYEFKQKNILGQVEKTLISPNFNAY
jgi:hypothetical protein